MTFLGRSLVEIFIIRELSTASAGQSAVFDGLQCYETIVLQRFTITYITKECQLTVSLKFNENFTLSESKNRINQANVLNCCLN